MVWIGRPKQILWRANNHIRQISPMTETFEAMAVFGETALQQTSAIA